MALLPVVFIVANFVLLGYCWVQFRQRWIDCVTAWRSEAGVDKDGWAWYSNVAYMAGVAVVGSLAILGQGSYWSALDPPAALRQLATVLIFTAGYGLVLVSIFFTATGLGETLNRPEPGGWAASRIPPDRFFVGTAGMMFLPPLTNWLISLS